MLNSDTTISDLADRTHRFFHDPDKGFDKSSFEVVFQKAILIWKQWELLKTGKAGFMFYVKSFLSW